MPDLRHLIRYAQHTPIKWLCAICVNSSVNCHSIVIDFNEIKIFPTDAQLMQQKSMIYGDIHHGNFWNP